MNGAWTIATIMLVISAAAIHFGSAGRSLLEFAALALMRALIFIGSVVLAFASALTQAVGTFAVAFPEGVRSTYRSYQG